MLLAGALIVAGGDDAWAQGGVGSSPVAPRLNTTGHPITLTLPAMDGMAYLGDILITITPDDRIQFSSSRVIDLLLNTLNTPALDNLRAQFTGKPVISPTDFANTGIKAVYDQQTLQLAFVIPIELKAARNLAVAPAVGPPAGAFVKPADFSAYINVRGSLDYVDKGTDTGFQGPVFFFDGATRLHDVVLESEAVYQNNSPGSDFQRQGSRFVYDDTDNTLRWSLGDLQPVGQGFQSVPEMSGLSLFRSYGVLDPLRSVRPSGDQSFQLTRPSNVTITVNGTNVRRVRLDPGNYNLRDFPFAQGANDVAVTIEDDTGRQETLRFNVFFDQTQLDVGLSEFGLFAGVKSPIGADGRDYTGDWEVTGYYRRGLTQELTAGINFQADRDTILGGAQALYASPIGTFGIDAAVSHLRGFDTGYAATLTYQRLFAFVGGQGDSLNLAATTRSRDFAPVGVTIPDNRFDYELSGAYTHAFDQTLYGSLTAHYSHGRIPGDDVQDYHAIVGYRLTPEIGLSLDASYQQGIQHDGFGALLTLTWSPTQTSSVRGDYNTRNNDARVTYQNVHGYGVGSYNISADVERSDDGSGINAAANYISNRAELGISHFTSFDNGGFGNLTDQRTSVRIATSIGFADGAVSIGRPITQAFAIVDAHRSLGGAEVVVNPGVFGSTASTDTLGTALEGDLAAYVPKTITVDVPNAPTGYDLGTGSFRVMPPYRGGYRLTVGSDYSVTALGRLVDGVGAPISLIAGKAIEVADPTREPVVLFTNAQGRFGLSGLRPGKWRIEMGTDPVTVYMLDVPEGTQGVLRAGDLKPADKGN